MTDDKKSNSQIVLRNAETDVLNLDLNEGFDQSMQILTKLVSSHKLNKVNSPEQALSMYLKTKELGLPFINGLDHIFEIGGKIGVDIHVLRAKVLRAGVIHWKLIDDFAPLYKYIDGTSVVAIETKDSYLPDTYEVIKGNTEEELRADRKRIKSIGKVPVFKQANIIILDSQGKYRYLDRKITYLFTRSIKIGGKDKILEEIGTFSLHDAIDGGLHLRKDGSVNVDSPWIKYQRNQLEHRAWAFGVRKIADDIVLGLYEVSELYDYNKIEYTVEDGNVVSVE